MDNVQLNVQKEACMGVIFTITILYNNNSYISQNYRDRKERRQREKSDTKRK